MPAKKGARRSGPKNEKVRITVPAGSGEPAVDKDSVRLRGGDALEFVSRSAGWKVELKLGKGEKSPFRNGKKTFKGPSPKGIVSKSYKPDGGKEKRFPYAVSVPDRPVLDPDIIIEPEDSP